MANTPIEDLRAHIIAAAKQGPVVLNSAFIKAASSALNPPDNYDDMLKAAWRLGDADGLKLTINANNVGDVSNDAFKVTAVQLTDGFLNASVANTDATLYFAQPADSLSNQIVAELLNWNFPDFFNWWNGWTFSQFITSKPSFAFSSEALKTFSWQRETISLDKGQNFTAIQTVPDVLKPLLSLLGLSSYDPKVITYGSTDLALVNNDTVLYPTMNLKAQLSSASLKFFSSTLKAPLLAFRLKPRPVIKRAIPLCWRQVMLCRRRMLMFSRM